MKLRHVEEQAAYRDKMSMNGLLLFVMVSVI